MLYKQELIFVFPEGERVRNFKIDRGRVIFNKYNTLINHVQILNHENIRIFYSYDKADSYVVGRNIECNGESNIKWYREANNPFNAFDNYLQQQYEEFLEWKAKSKK